MSHSIRQMIVADSLSLSLSHYVAYDTPGVPCAMDAYVAAWDERPEPSTFFVVLLPTEPGLPHHVHVSSFDALTPVAMIGEALEAYATVHQQLIVRWHAEDLPRASGMKPDGGSGLH